MLLLLEDGPVLDTVRPRSYIRWISSLYSVRDLSGIVGVNSTTSPIFSLHMGSPTGSWFSLGLSSSFNGNPCGVHLELPRPDVSERSIIVEFAGTSCTDICRVKRKYVIRRHFYESELYRTAINQPKQALYIAIVLLSIEDRFVKEQWKLEGFKFQKQTLSFSIMMTKTGPSGPQ